jgi:hypothetical protein
MTIPARKIHLLGTAEYRDQAEAMLRAVGDAALVERGVLRSLVMRCPDGCGQTLVVNLDPRAGKAWQLDLRHGTTTLYPSVWRDGGCESHFIVWKDVILWCDRFEDGNREPDYDQGIEPLVLEALPIDQHTDARTVALRLNLIVWDAAKALRRLVARGDAREGTDSLRGAYRRIFKD